MSDLSIRAAGLAVSQPNWSPEQQAETQENTVQAAGGSEEASFMESMLKERDERSESLAEMIESAQKKAAEQREALKLPKSSARYGDAPLEAYARLARAKTTAQVNSAAGYARRRLFQLKAALNSDPDNAPTIKGAINQLQKSINRAEKKKRELVREKLLDSQRAKALKAKEEQKARRLRQELQRRKSQRTVRESGYLREAVVSDKLHSQLTQTQMELRAQMRELSASTGVTLDAAVRQYAAQAAPDAPAAGASIEGVC